MLRFILIAILVVILVAVLMQLLVRYNVINYKMRIGIGVALLVFSIGIGVFTYNQDKNEAHLIQLTQSFLQGKVLQCQVATKTLEVSNKTFNFVSGTLTLMGKEDSEYKHTIIPLKACDIKEP